MVNLGCNASRPCQRIDGFTIWIPQTPHLLKNSHDGGTDQGHDNVSDQSARSGEFQGGRIGSSAVDKQVTIPDGRTECNKPTANVDGPEKHYGLYVAAGENGGLSATGVENINVRT